MLLQWLTRLALTPMDSINHSLIISREVLIDFNTANTTCPAGMYFLIHPSVWINDERMAVHCLESGCIGVHIPSDLEISLGPRDVQPNTSLLSAVYEYNTDGDDDSNQDDYETIFMMVMINTCKL